jgi:GT2 family glycosyltransferase
MTPESTQLLQRTAVVVVNFGSTALVRENLTPLTRAGLIGVVVDNFSTSAELGLLEEAATAEGWFIVASQVNRGFGGGANLGVERAWERGAEFVVLLNPDATLPAADAQSLVAKLAASEEPTLVAPTILRPDGTVWSAGNDLYLDDGHHRAASRRQPGAAVMPWLSGACLAFNRPTWDLVGGFDEGYFLYWEDVDLCYRLRDAGGQVALCDSAFAVHAQGGTQGVGQRQSGLPKSYAYYFYNIRNRLLFGAKHLDRADWRRWLLRTPSATWRILLQGGRRQILQSWEPTRAAALGVLEGLRLARRVRTRKEPVIPTESAASWARQSFEHESGDR